MSTSSISPLIDRLAVIGVGLIGGSVASALKARGLVGHVVGCARSAQTLDLAMERGLIDSGTTHVGEAASNADVVLLATPVGTMRNLLPQVGEALQTGAVVTDAGSTKQRVVDIARDVLADRFEDFVPGHPVAGSESSGPAAACSDLFVDHWTVLTPTAETNSASIQKVTQLWEQIGSKIKIMEADTHDRVLGMTSHLPHIVAYALVSQLAQQVDQDDCLALAAGGFFDITRVAGSNPVMWRDICLDNKEVTVELINAYQTILEQIKKSVSETDGESLEGLFKAAKLLRNRLEAIKIESKH